MTVRIPKLVTAKDLLFAPNMIWKYVVVTERINKLGKLEVHEEPCTTEEEVIETINNFMEFTVINPDAVKGVHYNYGVFMKMERVFKGVSHDTPNEM